MDITFERITAYPKGTLAALLRDGYSFDPRCAEHWSAAWGEFDRFFYGNPSMADRFGFVTALDGEPIGFVSWDPRNQPEFAVMGHNCIASRFKGRGFGKAQMSEAVNRIRLGGARRIIVTTSQLLLAARRNYESVGFRRVNVRENDGADAFSGNYIDYELVF